ncbi:MAG TPA: SMP-30/gluconolactonase/LRE family protein, partial [Acidimicrobiia bacterium]|nr:SMP-30/gluconolactonase/LRE family protein [Acidimicrobiia bacterium]
MTGLQELIGGIDFGEGPRWHDGRLWYSDFYQHRVAAVTADGERETMLEIDDHPSGLGWLPDGRLLVVSMQRKQVLRVETTGAVVEHADLSGIATGRCN